MEAQKRTSNAQEGSWFLEDWSQNTSGALEKLITHTQTKYK